MRLALAILLAPMLAWANPPHPTTMGFITACPLTVNNRCDNGTALATTRATTVPCGDGTAGVNEACVTAAGLDSFGATSNAVSNPTDFSAWTLGGDAVRTQNGDGSWRVCFPTGTLYGMEISRSYSGFITGDAVTGTFEIKRDLGITGLRTFFEIGGAPATLPLPPVGEWSRVSASGVRGAGSSRAYLYAAASSGACIDLRQAQIEKSPTPGRRCDAASCAADVHKESTVGFPTHEGSVCATANFGNTADSFSYVLDGRTSDTTPSGPFIARVLSSGNLTSGTGGAAYFVVASTWAWDQPHRYCVQRSGGLVSVSVDGRIVGGPVPAPAFEWGATVAIGSRWSGVQQLNGHISHLEVRQ